MSRSTYWAFYSLILTVRPAVICDIGSCDGNESIRFKKLRPKARVLAFEANNANYDRIVHNESIARLGVEVRHAAVTRSSGPVDFYEVDVPVGEPWAAGVSSLRRRGSSIAGELVERRVTVEGVRMDDVLIDVPGDKVGLWIDVEGAARDVVTGLGDALDRVAFMHIETEVTPLWIGEENGDRLVRELQDAGFEVIATGVTDHPDQKNIVVVSRRIKNFSAHVAAATAATQAFRLARLVPRDV